MSSQPLRTPARFISSIATRLFFGILVCIFSLNGVLRLIAEKGQGTRWSAALLTLAEIPDSMYARVSAGPFLLFELLFRWVLVSLAVYFLLLIVASARHWSPTLFASGMAGFLVGLFVLTWVSILLFLLYIVIVVVIWLRDLIGLIYTAILSFLLWPPVLYTVVTVIALLLLVGIISLVRGVSIAALWNSIKDSLGNLSARPVIFVFLLIVAAALIWFVGIPLWQNYIAPVLALIREWLVQNILPLLSWIATVLMTVVIGAVLLVLTLGSFLVLGWHFAEQFSSARFCGRNTHKLFEAGFANGAVLGMILLVCLSNPDFRSLVNVVWVDTSPVFSGMDLTATVYALMPAKAESLLHTAFSKASIPVFDTACLLIALLVANCSLATSLVAGVTIEPLRQLLRADRLPILGRLLFGVLIMVAVGLVSSVTEEAHD
jgi:hypothetical protein